MNKVHKGVICFALCVLAGCTRQSPSADYLTRLNNILDTKPELVEPAYPNFPEVRDLQIEQAAQAISIREFLSLRQCKLHLVLAERNSQLGKVAGASQILKNDLAILTTGPACLNKINNQALKAKLDDYLQVKRQRLPNIVWHALLAQNEYREFWHQRSHKPTYPATLSDVNAIDQLLTIDKFTHKILSGNYQISQDEFNKVEQALNALRHADGGQLLSELRIVRTNLFAATQAVNQRLKKKLCLRQQPTNKAKYLQNVVNQFFIAKVQKQAVQLKQRYEQLMPVIKKLESQLGGYATPAFQNWITQRDELFDESLTATLAHAQSIQKLYIQCGLKAGNQVDG